MHTSPKRTGVFFTVIDHPLNTFTGLVGEVVERDSQDSTYVWGVFDINGTNTQLRCFLPNQIYVLSSDDVIPDDRMYTVVPEIGSAMYRYQGQICISPMDVRGIPDFYEGCISPYFGTAFENTVDGQAAKTVYNQLIR